MNLWLPILLALPLSFVLSGIETALLVVSRVRVLHRAKGDDRRDAFIADLYNERANLVTSILILNNAATLTVFVAVTLALVGALGPWGYAASLAISLPVYLLVGELVPKSIAKRAPYRFLRACYPALLIISITVLPVVGLVRRALAIFKDGDSGITPSRHLADPESEEGREEFKTIAAMMETEGTLGATELAMIENVVDFHHFTAGDVMIPLSKMTAIPVDMPVGSVLDLAAQTRLDQFPAMDRDGNIVGLIDVFEILRGDRSGRAINFVRKLVRTHPDEPALDVVRRLRRSGSELAGVFNPTGRTLGIVSSEDMLTRMVVRE